MGVNLSTVNLDGVDPNLALDPIPAGWQNAVIVDSEMKPSGPNAKDPNGQYMALTLQIIDGEHAGRKLFDNLNLVNVNPTATEIAFKTLKAIYNAIGVAKVDDSAQMHGIPLKVKVKLTRATAEYAARNEIEGYEHVAGPHAVGAGGAGPAIGGGQPAWATQGAAAGTGAPAIAAQTAPWAQQQAAPPAAAAQAQPGAWQPPAAQQPWQQPAAQTAPAPAFTPPVQVQVDPMAGARADGWQAHPQHPGYSWRGQDVVSDADLMAHYPAPQAAPPVQQGPPAFQPPAQQAAPVAQGAPWAAQPPAQQAQPAFAAQGGPAPATAAAAGPAPPWAR